MTPTNQISGYSLRDCTTITGGIPAWAPGGSNVQSARRGEVEVRYFDEVDAEGHRFRVVCIACRAVWTRYGRDGSYAWRADGLPALDGGTIDVQTGIARCSCAWGQARWPNLPDAPPAAVRTALESAGRAILEHHRRGWPSELVKAAETLERVMTDRGKVLQSAIEGSSSPDPQGAGITGRGDSRSAHQTAPETPTPSKAETVPDTELW